MKERKKERKKVWCIKKQEPACNNNKIAETPRKIILKNVQCLHSTTSIIPIAFVKRFFPRLFVENSTEYSFISFSFLNWKSQDWNVTFLFILIVPWKVKKKKENSIQMKTILFSKIIVPLSIQCFLKKNCNSCTLHKRPTHFTFECIKRKMNIGRFYVTMVWIRYMSFSSICLL